MKNILLLFLIILPAATSALDLDKALNGDSQSQHELSIAYYFGEDGIEKNINEFYVWAKKSALQGHKKAQYNLGMHLKNDDNPKKDIEKAKHWFIQSSNQGYIPATYTLGLFYYLEGDLKKTADLYMYIDTENELLDGEEKYIMGKAIFDYVDSINENSPLSQNFDSLINNKLKSMHVKYLNFFVSSSRNGNNKSQDLLENLKNKGLMEFIKREGLEILKF